MRGSDEHNSSLVIETPRIHPHLPRLELLLLPLPLVVPLLLPLMLLFVILLLLFIGPTASGLPLERARAASSPPLWPMWIVLNVPIGSGDGSLCG